MRSSSTRSQPRSPQSIGRHRSTNRSMSRSTNRSANRPANRSMNRSTKRQVRWQSSQPQWGQNPFMLDDFDDIPVAVRDSDAFAQRGPSKQRFFVVVGGLAAVVGLGLGGAVAMLDAKPSLLARGDKPLASEVLDVSGFVGDRPLNNDASTSGSFVTPAAQSPSSQTAQGTAPGGSSAVKDAAQPSEAMALNEAGASDAKPVKTILGHYPFEEAASAELTQIAGGISLHRSTASAFTEMEAAAWADGVSLVPLSGFRSVEVQKDLFFNVKAERGQTAKERAKVSAPPGHSEHHTGYAIDIGDGRDSSTNLSQSFETTAAFAWLEENAPYYSFELSFPKGNPQGVNYEPWHWRYVGDQASLELFHQDR